MARIYVTCWTCSRKAQIPLVAIWTQEIIYRVPIFSGKFPASWALLQRLGHVWTPKEWKASSNQFFLSGQLFPKLQDNPLAAANKMSFLRLDALLCSRRFFQYSHLYINILWLSNRLCVCKMERLLVSAVSHKAARRPLPADHLAQLARGHCCHIGHLRQLLQLWVKFWVVYGSPCA